jgi:predicted O-linked N-acetylglucosamine transferase (SPINDLY family)
MEAMAAGCIIITSDLGALRETTAGFAHLLAPPSDKARHAELFADFAVSVLERFRSSPAEHAEWLKNQVHFVHQTETWAVRACEWEEWLSSMMTVRVDARAAAVPELLNVAIQHRQAGRLAEAEAIYRQMLGRHPGSVDLYNNLGNVLQEQGNFAEAVAQYRQAVTLQPDCAEVHNNMGGVFYAQGELEEARACFQRALALKPDYAEAHINLGNVLREQGKLEEALAQHRQALTLRPNSVEAECQSMHLMQHVCDWNRLTEIVERQKQLLSAGSSAPMHPFAFLCIPSTPAEQLRCARNFAAHRLAPVGRLRDKLGFRFTPKPKSKLRIGYLSADFRRHPVASLIAELFEFHDRQAVEVCAYSYGPDDGSEIRKRVARACDRFVDIRAASYVEAARRIYEDGVDILVDLQGHTRLARTHIAALRPAPLQVNWLGYPGTMGAECIDYIITDRFVTPPGHEPFFSEKIVYLPDCYQINDRKREIAKRTPARKKFGLPEKGVVFCCFNNSYKITPAVFDIWARLLQQVSGSVLWLLETNTGLAANLRREAKARGVEPERLVFAPILLPEQHLARYRIADLFLDTLLYNAHVTTSDALWAGLPVLTCAGETFASRVAGSLLTAIGLPELITHSPKEYEALALRLARTPSKLADLRGRLAKNRLTAPLFDSEQFTRHIERAYRMMWEQYLKGEGPGLIEVPALPPR